MLMRNNVAGVRTQEAGFASIVIAIVLVLLLSLTTVGFAQLMRSEEKSALDKHLSVQAEKAAESGINDAAKAINEGFAQPKTACGPWTDMSQAGAHFLTKDTVGNSGIGYSCLLIDPTPLSLAKSPVDDALHSWTFTITGINPDNTNDIVPIHRVIVGWQNKNGSGGFVTGGGHAFKKATDWHDTGVLRVSITPIASGLLSRDAMAAGTYSAYLYPDNKASTSAPGTSYYPASIGPNQGTIVDGNCHTGNPNQATGSDETLRYCNVEISGLSESNYLVQIRSIYQESDVSLIAFNTTLGKQIRIKNAQTIIDATGKAQDILRRIQVRVPSKDISIRTDYAAEVTDTLCKQYQLTPDATSSSNCP